MFVAGTQYIRFFSKIHSFTVVCAADETFYSPSCLIALLLCCCKQSELTCEQSLSQDKDHYREVHFPQSANP